MKKVILEVLASKGPLSEKKIRKATLKVEADEYEGKAEEFGTTFDGALASLMKKGKVTLCDDIYSLSAEEAGKKRKRAESDATDVKEANAININDVVADDLVTVQMKKGKNAKEQQSNKAWKYEELWKNGEKHWRDGTFDPEYLRTNPDK